MSLMTPQKRQKFGLAILAATLLVICAIIGCSGDSSSAPDDGPPAAGRGRWALRVNVGPEGRRVDFVPDAVVGSGVTSQPFQRALKTAAVNDVVTGTTFVPASKLLLGAAAVCGLEGSEMATTAWKDNAWFVFKPEAEPTTCDAVLRQEQITTCMADKLAELGEAVNVVRWDVPDIEQLKDLPRPWQILPQSDLDHFIARDLAIYTLGNLAQLNQTKLRKHAGNPQTGACSSILANARERPQQANLLDIFDSVAAGKIGMKTASSNTDPKLVSVLDDRLMLEAMTLRSASHMLRDLIETNIYADMAGANHRASQASDPGQANREIWGEEDPYNSLAHAMRVLAGTWISQLDPSNEPQCGTVLERFNSMSLLKTLGHELRFREQDLPIATQGQGDAATLISRAGILVNTTSKTDSDLRALVRHQLLVIAASQAGLIQNPTGSWSLPDKFEETPEGVRTLKVLDAVSGADLRFGLDRTARTFALITQRPDVPTFSTAGQPVDPRTTMLHYPFVVPELQSVGTVVKGGVSRDYLPSDISGRVYGAIASECRGISGGAALPISFADRRESPLVFQDSFAIAQSLFRDLHNLAEYLEGVVGDQYRPQITARQALAEMRPWAGGGRVYVAETRNSTAKIVIALDGLTPDDIGLSENFTKENIAQTLALADNGECAASLRPDCPSVPPTPITPDQVSTFTTEAGSSVRITFTSPDPNFQIPRWLFSRKGFQGKGMLVAPLYGAYLVAPMRADLTNKLFAFASGERSHDPRVGDRGAGRSDAYCLDGVTRDQFVPLENELTSQANDSAEESWKHYLSAAKVAAERADALGEKLIQLGMEQDTRREQAAQNLGQLCGDISSLDQLTPKPDGTIDASRATESLQLCLKEPQCDVVFLSRFNMDADNAKNVDRLKRTLACDGEGASSDVCLKFKANEAAQVVTKVVECTKDNVNLDSKTNVKVGSLHLFNFDNPNDGATSCGKVLAPQSEIIQPELGLLDTLRRTGFSHGKAGKLLAERFAQPSELHTAAYGMQMVVSPTSDSAAEVARAGQWRVLAGTLLMESDVSTSPGQTASAQDLPVWPSCLRGDPTKCDFAGNPRARLFNTLFRSRCPGGNQESCALGGPEGGDAMAEINALRWRVQGSLWMMGMLGGGVVESSFKTPIPAVNLRGRTENFQAPISTIYGYSGFDQDGFLSTTMPYPSTPKDRSILMKTLPVQGSPLSVWGNSFAALPNWYGEILRTRAANYQFVLGVENVEEPYKDDEGADPGWLYKSQNLNYIAMESNGATCPDYGGQPTNLGEGFRDLIVSDLALVKMAWSKDDRTATRGEAGAWFSPAAKGSKELWGRGGDYLRNAVWVHYDPNRNNHYEVKNWRDAYTGPNRKNRPIDVACQRVRPQDDEDGKWYADSLLNGAYCTATNNEGHYARPGDAGDWFNSSAEATPPSRRAKAFLNSGPAADACSALSEWVGAYGLACTLGELDASGIVPVNLPDPPPLDSENAIPRFQRWLAQLAIKVKDRASKDHARAVPLRAVLDFQAQRVATGSLKGAHGDSVVQVENGLNSLGEDWVTITSNLEALNKEIGSTQAIIRGVNRETEKRIKSLELQMARAIIADSATIIGGIVQLADPKSANRGAGVTNVISGGSNLIFDILTVNKEIDIERQRNDNEVLGQLIEVSKNARARIEQLSKTLISLRSNSNLVSSAGSRLQYQQDLASYYAAQGTGADYVVTADGATTAIPLNTVLRRQFSGTRLRYMRALKDAKAIAFYARRSIEQRLGVSMSDLHEAIGPLEAPATWADSVCHLAGIDYARLRSIGSTQTDAGPILEPSLGDGGFDRATIDAYADAYVGDYVAKLQNFVDYYNVQYPSHEADDTSILSVREDFLPREQACILPAPNLLYWSSQLDVQAVGDPFVGGKPGWEYTPCISPQKCLVARAATGFPDSVGPSEAVRSHVTVLSDAPFPPIDDPFADPPPTDSREGRVVKGVSPGYVSQAVALEDGDYVLSWWDQARPVPVSGTDGGVVSRERERYRVAVFKPNWDVAESSEPAPSEGDWSFRRELRFRASKGIYHIAFAASGTGAGLGAVAIAGVQLEQETNSSRYVETSARRENYSAVCPTPGPEVLRASFVRSCDDVTGSCYYDLDTPMIIDEVALQKGKWQVSSKIARGNYNYRHIDIAINLVGGGVRSCAYPNAPPSCSGTGFTEYSLYHDAQQVPILDWAGTPHYFNFGTGRIEHGKALTKERTIKLPIESADLAMLGMPGIQRLEYRGRPLDGRYRLRIWDDPALQWMNLEDIQLIVKQRYWSKVDRPSGSN